VPSRVAAAAAHPPAAAPDGYAELFAETERAAAREQEQPALFEVQPAPVDVAAAQPLHLPDAPGSASSGGAADTSTEHTEDESGVEDATLTVSHATRQAEIIAELRAELDARPGAVGRGRDHAADLDDDDLAAGASHGDDLDARADVGQGQGLST
jgi:hypothetical protein